MQLSENFWLHEFLVSQTAVRHDIPMDPPDSIVDNLIHEFGKWTHLGIADTLRLQTLTAYRRHSGTRYANGLLGVEELV